MVNAALNIVIFFRIAGHSVTVVGSDGSDGAYTKPLSTGYVAVAPGQTFDLLLEANQPPGRYYMAARVYALKAENVPITGIIEYAGNYTPSSPPPLFPSFPELNSWTESSYLTSNFSNQLRSLANKKHPINIPTNITHNLFFTVSMNGWPCNLPSCADPDGVLASLNVSMVLPATVDILDAYYRGIDGVYTADFPDFPPSVYDYTHDSKPANESRPRFGTRVRVLEYDAEVEIVFQGTILVGGLEHPMHLHGHSFYVVGSGYGNFDQAHDPPDYNLFNPPLMETIVVPRNGWTAIRFKANNPGVWFMHCHFERYQSWGMKMAFTVKDGKTLNEKMLAPPPDMPRCGREISSLPVGKISYSNQ